VSTQRAIIDDRKPSARSASQMSPASEGTPSSRLATSDVGLYTLDLTEGDEIHHPAREGFFGPV